VRKLKTDIWQKINNTLHVSAPSDDEPQDDAENIDPASGRRLNIIPDADESVVKSKQTDDKLSFQQLISSLATEQRQADVSLPYYFICLLHLANEKVCSMDCTTSSVVIIISFVYRHCALKTRKKWMTCGFPTMRLISNSRS
jgi:hypothetical protein